MKYVFVIVYIVNHNLILIISGHICYNSLPKRREEISQIKMFLTRTFDFRDFSSSFVILYNANTFSRTRVKIESRCKGQYLPLRRFFILMLLFFRLQLTINTFK